MEKLDEIADDIHPRINSMVHRYQVRIDKLERNSKMQTQEQSLLTCSYFFYNFLTTRLWTFYYVTFYSHFYI